MSSSDVFYGLGDMFYWLFMNTLEPMGDAVWITFMWLGFILFAYWMKRQMDYNKQAENNPNQLK